MSTPCTARLRLLAVALLSHACIAAGCTQDALSHSTASHAVAADTSALDVAELASLPIHLDTALGAGLHLVGLRVTTLPDHRSWIVTLYSTAVRAQTPRPRLWVHAYPQESATYFTLEPPAAFASVSVGDLVTDAFVLTRPGAFNLYAGVGGADGSLGPAVGLGWIGAGDPDTPEYHVAYRFLQEADEARAAAMLEQTQHAYPGARLP